MRDIMNRRESFSIRTIGFYCNRIVEEKNKVYHFLPLFSKDDQLMGWKDRSIVLRIFKPNQQLNEHFWYRKISNGTIPNWKHRGSRCCNTIKRRDTINNGFITLEMLIDTARSKSRHEQQAARANSKKSCGVAVATSPHCYLVQNAGTTTNFSREQETRRLG